MFRYKVLQNLVLPVGFSASATAVVLAVAPRSETEVNRLYRSSELPIYADECLGRSEPKIEEKTEPSDLEVGIRKVRKFVWSYYDTYKDYQDKAVHVIDTGIAHTQTSRQLLLEEENYLHRYGAIAIASLTGFVFGLRGGRFKRLTYATVGGLGMAAFCYPKEANEVTQEAIQQAKKYYTISYNFVFGVTPEDVTNASPAPESSATDQKGKMENVPDTKSELHSPGPGADQSSLADKNMYTTRS